MKYVDEFRDRGRAEVLVGEIRRLLAPAAGRDRRFNLEARFCCRFAADAATADRRRNCLLQLAATQDGGSVVYRPGGSACIRFPEAEGCLSKSAESCVELLELVSVALAGGLHLTDDGTASNCRKGAYIAAIDEVRGVICPSSVDGS